MNKNKYTKLTSLEKQYINEIIKFICECNKPKATKKNK